MAEWLRRLTRNQMGFPRAGSNPAHSDGVLRDTLTEHNRWEWLIFKDTSLEWTKQSNSHGDPRFSKNLRRFILLWRDTCTGMVGYQRTMLVHCKQLHNLLPLVVWTSGGQSLVKPSLLFLFSRIARTGMHLDIGCVMVGWTCVDLLWKSYQKWGSNPRGHTSIGS